MSIQIDLIGRIRCVSQMLLGNIQVPCFCHCRCLHWFFAAVLFPCPLVAYYWDDGQRTNHFTSRSIHFNILQRYNHELRDQCFGFWYITFNNVTEYIWQSIAASTIMHNVMLWLAVMCTYIASFSLSLSCSIAQHNFVCICCSNWIIFGWS